jgi:hypothetical protein
MIRFEEISIYFWKFRTYGPMKVTIYSAYSLIKNVTFPTKILVKLNSLSLSLSLSLSQNTHQTILTHSIPSRTRTVPSFSLNQNSSVLDNRSVLTGNSYTQPIQPLFTFPSHVSLFTCICLVCVSGNITNNDQSQKSCRELDTQGPLGTHWPLDALCLSTWM